MIFADSTIDSINENFRDISSGWLWSSENVYDAGYRHIYQQPISVEAATLYDLRWISGTSATTVTIRRESTNNSPVIWAGYAELIEENSNIFLTSADIPVLPAQKITPFKFRQTIPSSTWVINHDLDRYPNFSIRIETTGFVGKRLEPTSEYPDESTLILYWSQPFIGAVHLI